MSGIGKPALFFARKSSVSPLGEPATSNWRNCQELGACVFVHVPCHRTVALLTMKGSRMLIIRANSGIVTQINVFTVPEGGQDALIDLLAESAQFAREMPGWLSSSLHKSFDGTRVVNYAQSESLEAAQAIIPSAWRWISRPKQALRGSQSWPL